MQNKQIKFAARNSRKITVRKGFMNTLLTNIMRYKRFSTIVSGRKISKQPYVVRTLVRPSAAN